MKKEKLEYAVAISDYLHTLEGLQPLVWHQARGISERLAEVVMAHLTKRPPDRLRRWLAVSIFINVVLLAVVLFTIGGR